MHTVLTAAHLVGSTLAYGLGWWGDDWLTKHLDKSPRFIKTSQAIHKWYAKHGMVTVFATRFIGYVRPWSSLVAGFAHIDFLPFISCTFAGSVLFNIIVLVFTKHMLDLWYQFGYWFKISSATLCILSFSAIFLVYHFYFKSAQEEPVQE
ncbi:MAG TPA: VTT domain-containing protein [Syntrophomonadaceae bacterium]|nr:VTT domain-containing protein [Syntrophomonadaceae bacterium]